MYVPHNKVAMRVPSSKQILHVYLVAKPCFWVETFHNGRQQASNPYVLMAVDDNSGVCKEKGQGLRRQRNQVCRDKGTQFAETKEYELHTCCLLGNRG